MKDLGSAPLLEVKRTYDVIFIPVRLENMSYKQFIPAGNFKVNVTVPSRIDHRSLPSGPQKIGIMCDTVRNNAFEQQCAFPFTVELYVHFVNRL